MCWLRLFSWSRNKPEWLSQPRWKSSVKKHLRRFWILWWMQHYRSRSSIEYLDGMSRQMLFRSSSDCLLCCSMLISLMNITREANISSSDWHSASFSFRQSFLSSCQSRCEHFSCKFYSKLFNLNNFRHYEDSKKEGESMRQKGLCSLLLFVVIFPYTLR